MREVLSVSLYWFCVHNFWDFRLRGSVAMIRSQRPDVELKLPPSLDELRDRKCRAFLMLTESESQYVLNSLQHLISRNQLPASIDKEGIGYVKSPLETDLSWNDAYIAWTL